ncbi:hypothetical protein MNBD_GAMMA06-58 [hydrothermal vent metagenome]|uniref:Glycosyl transferase family 1 domain-containing protein n=1 Tax=hydrothermal vent metagenome TaxID=652676 RepID=A0A3B0X0F6_9ZZZZ
MKSLFIYEELFPPYDEGMKKFSHKIFQEIEAQMDVEAIRDILWMPAKINDLLIVPRILLSFFIKRPNVVVYIPKQSLTFFSLLKAFTLKLFIGKKLRTVGLQKRSITGGKKQLVQKINPGKTFALSHSMKKELAALNIDAEVIFTGIETSKFIPVENKSSLREKYNIPKDKIIILHVGHIKASRNLELLIDINKKFKHCQSVVVGSTATQQEQDVHKKCLEADVIVINQTIDSIEEVYALADIYCFPVKVDNGAMETPLSVLEAMSTNLPVITTNFGQLTELFQQDGDYKYIDNINDIDEKMIDELTTGNCHNREKVSEFTWQATTTKILAL